uniref:HECT domain-containing protein n=1 Tax=Cyprinus carpio TaxID=7962 RepID=A0A8C1P360_CYPCA
MDKTVPQLLREAAQALERSANAAPSDSERLSSSLRMTPPDRSGGTRAEVLRLFAPYSNSRGRMPKRPNTAGPSAKKSKSVSYTHRFFCLSKRKECEVPSPSVKNKLERSGIGEKRITFPDKYCTPQDFSDHLFQHFPILKECGGFQLLRSRGSTRSKILETIPCPDDGYCPEYLLSESVMIGQAVIYIRPLQKDIDVQNLESDQPVSTGPLTECLYCNKKYSLSEIQDHVDVCEKLHESGKVISDNTGSTRQEEMSATMSEDYAEREERASTSLTTFFSATTSPSAEPATEEWKIEPDLETAARLFRRHILKNAEDKPDLVVTLDLHSCEKDREREMLTFYKRPNIDWTSPFTVKLKGDAALGDGVTRHFFTLVMDKLHNGFELDIDNCGKTLLFNGEDDHKVPSTSRPLLDGDLFRVVGRMIGHSFINGGPLYSGLSAAFFPLLSGSKDDTPILELKDCPDTDVIEVVSLLESQNELNPNEMDSINNLAISWDLPAVSNINRRWLAETILYHGVIGRREKQIAQLRRGLKDTGVLRMIKEQTSLAGVLFPRSSALVLEPEMILKRVIWPEPDSDEDEAQFNLEQSCDVTAFLREYIQTGSPAELCELMKFWTGWTVLPQHLYVEVSPDLTLPVASTCLTTLKLPLRCRTFLAFTQAMRAAVSSTSQS